MGDVSWGTLSVASAGWALAFLFAALIYNGKLVPRRTLDDATHDRDEWRTESRIKDQQIAEKDQQLIHLAEVGETSKALLTSISKLTGRG